jgi:Protein of unknown function (DUF1176)
VRRGALILLTLAVLAGTAAAAGGLPGTKTATDRVAWRALLHWPRSCESDWQIGHPDTAGVVSWKAGARKLVAVDCILGAYQGTQMLYLVDAAKKVTGPLRLHLYVDPGTRKPKPTYRMRVLGVATFTPATGRLVIFDRFRGIGDCGVYSTFRLAGARFVPVEVRAKLACDGKGGGDPSRWPKLPVPAP